MLRNMLSLLLSKFYSKKDAALVAHQAIPELSQYIDLASSTTTNVENTYVAPTDGYFVCATKGGEGSGVNVWGTLDVGAPGAIGIQGKVFAPCAKGVSVHYIIYGTIHLVRFYKTIGGGYQALKNALLQGGGLCLKHLYSSLRRNSCRVRERGFNTQLVRPWMQRPSALQPTVIGTRLHPAGTVMSHTLETPQALFWKSLVVAQVSLILNRLQDGILFRYRKVKNLVISFQQIQQFRICTLSLCEEKTNFAVGGASC